MPWWWKSSLHIHRNPWTRLKQASRVPPCTLAVRMYIKAKPSLSSKSPNPTKAGKIKSLLYTPRKLGVTFLCDLSAGSHLLTHLALPFGFPGRWFYRLLSHKIETVFLLKPNIWILVDVYKMFLKFLCIFKLWNKIWVGIFHPHPFPITLSLRLILLVQLPLQGRMCLWLQLKSCLSPAPTLGLECRCHQTYTFSKASMVCRIIMPSIPNISMY